MDPETDRKDYVVYAQAPAPQTPIYFTYLKDSEGEEYENLIDDMSVSEITLYVRRVR